MKCITLLIMLTCISFNDSNEFHDISGKEITGQGKNSEGEFFDFTLIYGALDDMTNQESYFFITLYMYSNRLSATFIKDPEKFFIFNAGYLSMTDELGRFYEAVKQY